MHGPHRNVLPFPGVSYSLIHLHILFCPSTISKALFLFFSEFVKFECDERVFQLVEVDACWSHDGSVYIGTHTKHHDVHGWKLLDHCYFCIEFIP